MFDILAARSEPKLVYYHNITPAELLRDWEPAVAYETSLGRSQLARLAPQSRFAVVRLGLQRRRAPRARLRGDRRGAAPDRHARQERRARSRAGQVAGAPQGPRRRGRLALCGQDLARTRHRTTWSRCSTSCGGPTIPHAAPAPGGLASSSEKYERALLAFIDELGLSEVALLPGSVTGAELEAYYEAADVFVMASDHEGFCVPLAEAMGHSVPIVAYGVAAIPETVGDAGLLLPDKSPVLFAAAVARVLADPTLRQVLAAAGRGSVPHRTTSLRRRNAPCRSIQEAIERP